MLGTGIAAGLSLGACGDGPSSAPPTPTPAQVLPEPTELPTQTAPPQPATLTLVGWPFRPDLLRERLTSFEQARGDVQVRHEQALRNYGARGRATLAREPPTDVVQVREGLGGAWWAQGALRGLGDEAGWENTLDAMWPHARAATVNDGAVVGLPYYSDVMLLAYNRRLLDGLGAPVPATLEQLTSVSLAAARQRIVEFPLSLNLAPKAFADLPWWGLVYAAGGSLQRPDGPDPAAVAVLEWLRAAIAVDGIVDPSFTEATYEVLALEKHLFAIVGGYVLKKLNSVAPGTFDIAPIPGISGPAGTVAWTPFYAVSAASRHPDLAIELVRFLGGRAASGTFESAAFWLRHEGLIPAYRELLHSPELRSEMTAWVNPERLETVLGSGRPVEGLWAPWFLTWEHEMQSLVQEALFGKREPEEALTVAHQRAVELSSAPAAP